MAKEIYSMGVWQIKQGKENEFISEWREFAKWTVGQQDGASDGRLLRDITKNGRFASFGSWKSEEHSGKWRESPVFKKFMAKAKELCEEARIGTFEVVAHVTK